MHRLLAATLAALLALPLLAAGAGHPDRTAALRGVEFIRTTQQPDGGFGPFGQTMDAIYAIRAAGLDPNTFAAGGNSPAAYLRSNAPSATKPANAAKAALGARALGLDPRNIEGTDLITAIENGFAPDTGRFAEDDFSQSIAMLGLACSGVATPSTAIRALREAQAADGGWGFGGFSDPDTTAIALQALVASGVPRGDSSIVKGVAYLRATQAADGGWGYGGDSNASSTAFVVQGLVASGEQVESATYAKGKASPVTFLLAQQNPDGSFKGFDAAFATNQAVPALAARGFCETSTTPITPAPALTPPKPPATGSGLAAIPSQGGMLVVVGLALVTAGSAALTLRRSQR
ncbi:hypothetical protein EDM76_09190 [bacterium]|nr:MAG: hypothetical protein EDM76_09190 [bacterium]MCL4230528.1 hypothetical protein [Dehalococcoidia bacterium]